jgi:hypothetical protein
LHAVEQAHYLRTPSQNRIVPTTTQAAGG